MVSFIALTITFILVAFLLGIFDSIGKDMFIVPVLVAAFFGAMLLVGVVSLLFIVFAVPILLAAVMLMAIFIALTIAFVFAKALYSLKLTKEQVGEIREAIYSLYDIFGLGLMLKSLKVMIFALPVLGAAVMIMGIMVSLMVAYKAIAKLRQLQRDVDPRPVIDAVMTLMDIVKKAGEAMKGMSKKASEAFAITLGAIVEAIDSMVDVIIKLSYFDTEEGNDELESARASLQKVINDFFLSDTGVMGILGNLKGISKSQLRTAEALAPITEAISNITDVIIKLKDINNVEEGTQKVLTLMNFTAKLIEFASGFTKTPVGGVFGAIKGFLIGDQADTIQNATNVVQKLPELVDALASLNDSIKNISGLNEASQNVLDMANFVVKLIDFAGTFKKGGWFSDGTKEEVSTAVGVLRALKPMIDELTILNGKIIAIASVDASIRKIDNLIKLTRDVAGIAIYLSSNSDKMNRSVDAAKKLVSASSELVKMSKNIDQLGQLKVALENNIVQPLMELEKPADKLQQVTNAVSRLNSELTKLARENKDTLKTVASIGNASAGGVLSFIGDKIKSAFTASSNAASDRAANEMAANIAVIKKSVVRLDDKLTKDTKTWTAPQGGRR
jgi:hypothetical protein